MRLLAALLTLALAACSGKAYRLGSPLPPDAPLSAGRVVEGQGCDFFLASQERFKRAYGELRRAAGKDLITDVEVSEDRNCTWLRARAVKPVAKAPPPS